MKQTISMRKSRRQKKAKKTLDTTRVAIYIRVSTLDQAREGYSLAAQERTLRAWCEAHKCVVVKVYADEGISGKDIEHRPGMCEMLEDAQLERFDLVLVWALSRLTRSVADLYDTWDMLQTIGIDMKSHTEPFDTGTPIGRAMMGLLGVFAQMEREITAERVSIAMAERAAQGKRTCNEILGYDLEGKHSLRINEKEAERVRYIFDKFIEYKNLSAVAELCRLRGYTGKRGRIPTAESIRKVLNCPVYAGFNRFKGDLYQGIHPPIISPRQYNDAQKILHRYKPDAARYVPERKAA